MADGNAILAQHGNSPEWQAYRAARDRLNWHVLSDRQRLVALRLAADRADEQALIAAGYTGPVLDHVRRRIASETIAARVLQS